MTVPVSAVIPTGNRSRRLRRTLESIASQSIHPFEIVIVDASKSTKTKEVCAQRIPDLQARVGWFPTKFHCTAPQRNQRISLATQPFIWFLNDDIVLKP